MTIAYSINCLKLILPIKSRIKKERINKKIKMKLHQNITNNYKFKKVKKYKINKINKYKKQVILITDYKHNFWKELSLILTKMKTNWNKKSKENNII